MGYADFNFFGSGSSGLGSYHILANQLGSNVATEAMVSTYETLNAGNMTTQIEALTVERNANIAELAQARAERDKQISESAFNAGNMTAQIEALTIERNAYIAELARVRAERDRQISESAFNAGNMTAQIEALTVERNANIAELAQVRAERDKQISESALQASQLNEMIADHRTLVVEFNALISDRLAMEAQRDNLANALSAIENSRSWRVTQPLRYSVEWIRKQYSKWNL